MIRSKSAKKIIFHLSEDFHLELNLIFFSIFMGIITLLTIFHPILALFSVPTYLGILFAIFSDKAELKENVIGSHSEE